MMKKTVLVIATLLFFVSVSAYDLNACMNDGNFSGIGNCIVRGAFGADPRFLGMIILVLFALFLWQARVPEGVGLAIGLLVIFALGGGQAAPQSGFLGELYPVLFNLGVVAIGGIVGLAVIRLAGGR